MKSVVVVLLLLLPTEAYPFDDYDLHLIKAPFNKQDSIQKDYFDSVCSIFPKIPFFFSFSKSPRLKGKSIEKTCFKFDNFFIKLSCKMASKDFFMNAQMFFYHYKKKVAFKFVNLKLNINKEVSILKNVM